LSSKSRITSKNGSTDQSRSDVLSTQGGPSAVDRGFSTGCPLRGPGPPQRCGRRGRGGGGPPAPSGATPQRPRTRAPAPGRPSRGSRPRGESLIPPCPKAEDGDPGRIGTLGPWVSLEVERVPIGARRAKEEVRVGCGRYPRTHRRVVGPEGGAGGSGGGGGGLPTAWSNSTLALKRPRSGGSGPPPPALGPWGERGGGGGGGGRRELKIDCV